MCKKLDFGEIMKEHRKKKCLSLSKVSEETGLSRGYISKLENNKRKISNLYTLIKLCSYLDISVNLILENLIETEKNQNKTI